MEKDEIIQQIMKEWLWRLDDPSKPDMNNSVHLYHLKEALKTLEISDSIINELFNNLSEEDKEDSDSKDDSEQRNDSESKDNEEDEVSVKTEFPDDVGEKDKVTVDDKTYRKDMLTKGELKDISKKLKKQKTKKKSSKSGDVNG